MTREEAIEVLKKNRPDRCFELLREAVDIAIEALQQSEHKTGKWKENDNGSYSCSLCQAWIPSEQRYYARYCLHCGAKMGYQIDTAQLRSKDG